MKSLFFVCLLAVTASVYGAGLSVPGFIGGNMVVQRDRPVPVWGKAAAGENVEVTFGEQKRTTFANKKGDWRVIFDAVKAGGPFMMEIKAGNEKLTFGNILAGDVFFAGGQSNMAFKLKTMDPGEVAEEIAAAEFPEIRCYYTANIVSGGKILNATDRSWESAEGQKVLEWSAVAYLTAKELYRVYKVPVGIINCSHGSSTSEAWISPEAFTGDSVLRAAVYKEYDGIQALYRNPSVLYRKMLLPYEGIPLKGIIWYQGESNAYDPVGYGTVFSALITDWRRFFHDPALPFVFAQLPAYRMPGDTTGEKWAEMRQIQLDITRRTPCTAIVVTSEYGEADNIHPRNKRPVAERFVKAVRGVAYGENILYQLSFPEAALSDGKRVIVEIPGITSGLVLKDDKPMMEMCGKDGIYHPAACKIKNNKLIITSEQVGKPYGVRYAWGNVNRLSVYHESGVPLSPFRLKVTSKKP